MRKKKGSRYEMLKFWLTISKEEYYKIKSNETQTNASMIEICDTFGITIKQYNVLKYLNVLPESIPKWTIPFIDRTKSDIANFAHVKDFKEKINHTELDDSEIRSIIKRTLKGVPYASKVYHIKDKKYPLALLLHPKFKEKFQQELKNFLVEKQEAIRIENLAGLVNPKMRDRETPPKEVILHLGPTNSGKTRHAIEAMVTEHFLNPQGTVAYGGPLRMLAMEVYETLVEMLGEQSVGLITGEQEINPDAPVLACTVECVPQQGSLLVVDECHWSMDNDRGKSWTNVLQSAEYESIIVLGPEEVEPHMRYLLADAEDIKTHYHKRLVPLEALLDKNNKVTRFDVQNVPKKSAVVSFSKKSVVALQHDIAEATGYHVAALYGKMPIDARNDVVEKFSQGEIDIVVCTDVIGHGINLPIETLLFAETEKYDGNTRRSLKIWEGAQIAGRAGRYGLSEKGKVGILSTQWGSVKETLIKEYVQAASGIIPTELGHMRCVAYPTLAQLGGETIRTEDIPYLIHHWKNKMNEYLQETPEMKQYIQVSTMQTAIDNWNVVYNTSSHLVKETKCVPLSTILAWQIINAPIDTESPVLVQGTKYITNGNTRGLLNIIKDLEKKHSSKESIETSYRILTELMSFALMFGDENGSIPEVAQRIELEHIENKLMNHYATLQDNNIPGRCVTCGGKTKAPWLEKCDDCFYNRFYFDDFYDYKFVLTEEDREKHNEISRTWNRLKSTACREVSQWFDIGDNVKILYRGREYDAEIVKINKVTIKVQFHLQNGDVREKNIDSIYVAKDNGMEEKLQNLKSYQEFLEAEKPERYW